MKKVAISLHAKEVIDPDIIKDLKGLDYIHVDVMDGTFVKNKQNNLEIFKILKENYNLPIIGHFMVTYPLNHVDNVIENTDIFVFHYESEGNKDTIINKIKMFNKKVGIAINPDTSISNIIPYLNKIDVVLIMAVNPGYSGQKFISTTPDKINELIVSRHKHNLKFDIDVDGGVGPENARLLKSDILTSASAILNANNPNFIIQLFKTSDES
jgi:ribulose-phosphate 3-epimerase